MNFKRLRHRVRLEGKWIRLANFDVIAKAKRDMATEMGLIMFKEGLIRINYQKPAENADAIEIEMETFVVSPKTLKQLLSKAWELGASYGDVESLHEAREAFNSFITAVKDENPGNILNLEEDD